MSDNQPEIGINEAQIIRGDHGVHVEPDHRAGGRVAMVGGIAVASFILASLWAGWLYSAARKEFAPDGLPPIPTELTENHYEIGIVNQWQFKSDHRAEALHKQRAAQLQDFGWVDRNQQRIHAPVESAFAEVIGDRGAPQGGAAAPQAPAGEDTDTESQGTPAPGQPQQPQTP